MNGVAYQLLAISLLRIHPKESILAVALGKDGKGYLSLALYSISIPLAFVEAGISLAIYVVVAAIWFIPDRRIERK